MSHESKYLTIVVGVLYLCVALSASIFPAMYLFYASKAEVFSVSSMTLLGELALMFGPCYLIAYSWIRGKKWGRYLLIVYNGSWLIHFIYILVASLTGTSPLETGFATTSLFFMMLLFGSLIGLTFRVDVKAALNR